jgi:hypothetical protein
MSVIDPDQNLKIELKARLRLPALLKYNNLDLDEAKLQTKKDKKDKKLLYSFSAKKIMQNNYSKYIQKTNLLKLVMSKMSIKDIYSQEKECSKFCSDVYEKIKNLKIPSKNYIKLPKIVQNGGNNKRYSISLKLKSEKKFDNLNCSIFSIKPSKSNSSISSIRRKNNESYTPKNINEDDNDKKSQICRKMQSMLNNKNNFTIIKGGIKYNNSFFRIKNMKHLL